MYRIMVSTNVYYKCLLAVRLSKSQFLKETKRQVTSSNEQIIAQITSGNKKTKFFYCVKWKAYKIMTVQKSANWISKKETAAKSKLFNGDGSPQK